MKPHGSLHVDPGTLETGDAENGIVVVVPFTGEALTRKVLERIPALTGGLNARVLLMTVHAAPNGECPGATHAFLVEQLVALASDCPLPADVEVVLAGTPEDGYRHALKTPSTILVGSRKRLWRTAEENLAWTLAEQGHNVVLVHLEKADA